MDSLLSALAAAIGAVVLVSKASFSLKVAVELGAALFVAGVVSIKTVRAMIWPVYFSELRHLPGPKDGNQFLVGQAVRQITAAGPNELYLQWMRQWPDAPFIRHLSWGNSEVVLVNSLEACREVLQTKAYSFVKPAFFHKLVGEMMGTGVLFSVGDHHRKLRRIMAGPLSRPSIRKLLPIFQAKGRELSAQVDAAVADNPDGVVEIEALFIKAALSAIGESLLGQDLATFRTTTSSLSFEECYHGMLSQPALGQIITFINPFIPLRWLPVAANQNFIRANTTLKFMLKDLIGRRVLEFRAGGKPSEESRREAPDLLTRLIEENLSEKQAVSDLELSECVLQSISAGHETTAGAMTWTTFALATNLDFQRRLREEVLAVLKDDPDPDAAVIDNMQFLNNVVRESLRLYSPSLMVPWETAEDLIIAGVKLPRGTTVNTVPAMVQLNPTIWGEDAEVFNPDRWDELDGSAASPFAMEAFINGPRMCPGKALALLEMKAMLMDVVSNFEFTAVDKTLELQNPTLTLKPKGGLRLRMQRL